MADELSTKDPAFGLVEERRRVAESYRTRYESDWYLNLAYFEGDQWCLWNGRGLYRPDFGPSRLTLTDNRIQPAVRIEVAKLSKNRPCWVAVPRGGDEQDVNDATTAERLLEWGYDSLDFARVRREALLWSRITGAGFVKVTWDPNKGNDGVEVWVKPDGTPIQHPDNGRVLTVADHPEIGEIDGVTTKNVGGGDVVLDVRSAFDIFPDPLATSLEDCRWIIDERVRSPEYIQDRYGKKVEPDAPADVGITQSRYMQNSGGKNVGVRVWEMWEPASQQNPQGRHVVWTRSGILVDEDNSYGCIPYVMFTGVVVPGRFWPDSVVSQLRSPQVARNKLISQIAENAARFGNPSMIIDRLSGLKYHGLPGETLYVNGTTPTAFPQYLQPPAMPGYVFDLLGQLDEAMLEISGSTEVSQGQVPAGVTAASAISLLQEQDATRLAPEVESMENALSRIGQMVLKLMAENYTAERTLVIVGEDGVFDIDAFKADESYKVPNVTVQAGSTFPRSLAAKQAAIRDVLNLMLQYGVPITPDALGKTLKDMQVGGLERIVESVTADQEQVSRENANFYREVYPQITPVDNHAMHIAGHSSEAKSARFQNLDPSLQQVMYAHIAQHKAELAKNQAPAMPPGINPPPGEAPAPAGGTQPLAAVPTAPSGNAAPMISGDFTPGPTVQ